MAAQMPSLIAAVAGTTSNTYVTLAFADDYFGAMLEWDEWSAHEEADRSRALVSATRTIDQELRGFGAWYQKYDFIDPEQMLMFPRTVDRDDTGSLEIPDAVEEATCLLALHLLRRKSGMIGPVDPAAMEEANVRSIGTGGISMSLGQPRWSEWPRNVRRLMQPYINRQAKGVMRRHIRKRRWHEGWIAQGE